MDKDGLELWVLLSSPPDLWDYRSLSPLPVLRGAETGPRAWCMLGEPTTDQAILRGAETGPRAWCMLGEPTTDQAPMPCPAAS